MNSREDVFTTTCPDCECEECICYDGEHEDGGYDIAPGYEDL